MRVLSIALQLLALLLTADAAVAAALLVNSFQATNEHTNTKKMFPFKFSDTETMRTIGDGEPRTATSTSTQLLSSEFSLPPPPPFF